MTVARTLRAVAPIAPNQTSMKKPIRRVRWTSDEQKRVVARAREFIAETPRMPLHVAARRAQEEVLPPDRWRQFRQHKDVEHLIPASSSAPAPIPRPFPRAIRAAAPIPAQAMPVEPPPAPPPLSSVDPAIVRAVAEQIAPMLAATIDACMLRLVDVLGGLVPAHGGPTPPASQCDAHTLAPPPRTRLPRVTVVGLIPQQERDVQAAFAGVIEFIFVKAQRTGGGGHGGAGMLTKSASSDVVVAMTDFIGHDVEASAKHLHIPYQRVTGSVSALKRWLTDWLATGRGAA